MASPTTLAPDPTRKHYPENKEQKVAGIYGDIYVTDKYEGLICVGIATTIEDAVLRYCRGVLEDDLTVLVLTARG